MKDPQTTEHKCKTLCGGNDDRLYCVECKKEFVAMNNPQTTKAEPLPALKCSATWTIELNLECPECERYFDALDTMDFWDGRNLKIGEHGTQNSKDVSVECPHCCRELLMELEY